MGKTLYYVVIRLWPGGRQEYLGATTEEGKARYFAYREVSLDFKYYVVIQTVREIEDDDQH